MNRLAGHAPRRRRKEWPYRQLRWITHDIDVRRDHDDVKAATTQLASGGAVILTDDPDRPTSGELVFAASRITAAATAFAIRHTSGFLQVALPSQRCDALALPGQSGTDPAARQCVTVDASVGIRTGISAADRAHTIRLLTDDNSSPDSFTRPGHVVPIRADIHSGESLSGTPEAAIHLVSVAGLPPGAAMATIVSLDRPAEIAAGSELRGFAKSHGLPLVGIGDIHRALPRPAAPAGGLRFETFTEAGVEYLCLANGDLEGRRNVLLTILPIEAMFAAAAELGSEPRILIGSPDFDRTSRVGTQLLQTIWRPNSTLRQLLHRLGCRSVSAQCP